MSAKWLGVKKMRLDSIVLPGGFAKRKKEEHVRDLAESIKRGGVISLPVVCADTRKLVAGGDRLAALQLLKVAQHDVRLVEGTPAELEAITIEENLWRRRNDDYDALTVRLIDLVAKDDAGQQTVLYRAKHRFKGEGKATELVANVTSNPEPARPGRPKTEHGAARDEVAARLGKTPEAVRQAEKRAKAKEREAAEEQVPEAQRLAQKPPVTTYGVMLSVDLARDIVTLQEQIDAADAHLRRAQSAITSMSRLGGMGTALAQRVQADLHRAADTVRRERPDSVCPCCKLTSPQCTFCGGLGVVSEDKLTACAAELLISGPKAVVVDGRGGFTPYATAAKAQPADREIREEDLAF